MKARRILVVFTFGLICLTLSASAATLRGQLVCNNGMAAAVNIAVTVYNPQIGRSVAAFTGADGMYYLNIPPGVYTVEIWLSRQSTTPTFSFQNIFVRELITDLPRQNLGVCFAQ